MEATRSVRCVHRILVRYVVVLAILATVACNPAPTEPQAAEEAIQSEISQVLAPLPLSEPGPYRVDAREFSSQDASRNGRGVGVRVWYPAVSTGDATEKRVILLADPDRSGAPYPLILSSAKVGSLSWPKTSSVR